MWKVVNMIKIRSLICTSLLIYHGIWGNPVTGHMRVY